MTVKRALVVDDSKSARAFLARILERHDLVVDTAESAEEAIDYLRQQRPDVIFMDHLMPGMDGFQAVQAIKNDPRTATIPILMYTSQEGELYLSQARALGALGVLPKQTKPADVSKALFQLHLLPERRTQDSSATTIIAPSATAAPVPAAAAAPPMSVMAERQELRVLPADVRALVESLLQEQSVELRRFVVENLESNADRIVGDLRLLLRDETPAASREPSGASRLALVLGGLAAVLAIGVGVLWYRALDQQRQLQQQLTGVQTELQQASAHMQTLAAAPLVAPAAAGAVLPEAATIAADTVIEPVPFGEAPLSGARVERVQALLERLAAQNFQGVVQLRSFPGRFCVAAGGTDGVASAPASAETPYARCDSVGNPLDSATAAQRESVAFANMVAAQRARAGNAFEVQIGSGSAEEVQQAYPAVTDALTAGEWNRAAAANNRLEVHWSPRR